MERGVDDSSLRPNGRYKWPGNEEELSIPRRSILGVGQKTTAEATRIESVAGGTGEKYLIYNRLSHYSHLIGLINLIS